MKVVAAFFRLVRWPNLLFIALTQCLFYYYITLPVFAQHQSLPAIQEPLFFLLSIASVMIAAAGYIINDYFDLNIDRVNKPAKLVIEKLIKRRWAILWHLLLSSGGVLISIFVAFKLSDWHSYLAAFINLLCVGSLWLYSTTYKRKLLVGNILISLLTAWTILVLYVINRKSWASTNALYEVQNYNIASNKLFKFAILYAGFAFIISMIREVVKDMEDMEGDEKYGCRTMPIVWGVPASKVFAAVWIIVLIASLCIVQYYFLQFGRWASAFYCSLLIILPLIWILKKLYEAQVPADYHRISSALKFVMLTGILSMLFFKLYW